MSSYSSKRDPLVCISQLNYSYAGADGEVSILRDVELTLDPGEFLSILGPSGGGKSTFMNLIGGLDRPKSGRVVVGGRDITKLALTDLERYRQQEVAFIFQFFNLLPTLTALENVLLGMEAMSTPPKDARARASRFLKAVGLSAKMERLPSQLSGGEQQRVAIARALAKECPLILADEPTGNLDEENSAQVMDLITTVQKESGAALILITHDLNVASRASRVVKLVKGRLEAVNNQENTHEFARSKTA